MAIIDPDDIIGRTYLTMPREDGQQFRLKIVEALDQRDRDIATNPTMKRFRATSTDGTIEEIVSYNQILDRLCREDGEDGEWHFKTIDGHQGPLAPSDPDYMGSRWNVRVAWENGEVTFEPLGIIAKSDPVTCATYARENGLLDLDGWKQF